MKTESIELSHLDRFNGWGFRINGAEWGECKQTVGFTPRSDSAEHLQEAVVAIAHAHDLIIREDQVAVDGLSAYHYAQENPNP